jgi:hypothetical protein
MDMGLPDWLDMTKIGGLAVLTLVVIQYLKGSIPVKFIKPATLLVGIVLAYLGERYVGSAVVWVKIIVNGLLAGIMSDVGYGLLSNKGGSGTFTLPSKDQLTKPGP